MSSGKDPEQLAGLIDETVRELSRSASGSTRYRDPLIGFAAADDARFRELRLLVDPSVLLPSDVLPGARSVVSFFLPFSEDVVNANRAERETVAREWAVAYVETNRLLAEIATRLVERLGELSVRAAADPPTGRFDRDRLCAPLPHKSGAVIAGLGSLGVHSMLITERGCAGRLNTLVVDTELPPTGRADDGAPTAERCAFLRDGSCLECVERCPVGAIAADAPLDKHTCWARCRAVGERFTDVGRAEVCGKCAVGRCSLEAG